MQWISQAQGQEDQKPLFYIGHAVIHGQNIATSFGTDLVPKQFRTAVKPLFSHNCWKSIQDSGSRQKEQN